MNKWSWLVLACAVGVGVTYLPSARAYKGADKDKAAEAAEAEPKGLDVIAFARRLADFGRAQGHPEMLLLAARLLHKADAEPIKVELEGATAAEVDHYDPKKLLADAREMDSDDKVVAGLRAAVSRELKEKTRGVVGGPKKFGPILIGPSSGAELRYVLDTKQAIIDLRLNDDAFLEKAQQIAARAEAAQKAARSFSRQAAAAFAASAQQAKLALAQMTPAARKPFQIAAAVKYHSAENLNRQANSAHAKGVKLHEDAVKAMAVAASVGKDVKADDKHLQELLTGAKAASVAAQKAAKANDDAKATMEAFFVKFTKNPTDPTLGKLDSKEAEYKKAQEDADKAAAAARAAHATLKAARDTMKVELVVGGKVVQTKVGTSVRLIHTPKKQELYSIRVANPSKSFIVLVGSTN